MKRHLFAAAAFASNTDQGGPIPFDSIVVSGARAIGAQKSTPVEPGRVGTVVQLTAKYEMTR